MLTEKLIQMIFGGWHQNCSLSAELANDYHTLEQSDSAIAYTMHINDYNLTMHFLIMQERCYGNVSKTERLVLKQLQTNPTSGELNPFCRSETRVNGESCVKLQPNHNDDQ